MPPQEIPKEKLKLINAETYELRIALPKRVQEKIEKLKMLMGPEKASVETIEALEKGLDLAISDYENKFSNSQKKMTNQSKAESKDKSKSQPEMEKEGKSESQGKIKPQSYVASQDKLVPQSMIRSEGELKSQNKIESQVKVQTQENKLDKFAAPRIQEIGISQPRSNSISVHIKREVWTRYKGQCFFINPITKQRCPSKFRLEIDHIKPRALGGSNEIDNLRLACKSHNQWAAIQQFGLEKMAAYIS